jgi:hypothetical protein
MGMEALMSGTPRAVMRLLLMMAGCALMPAVVSADAGATPTDTAVTSEEREDLVRLMQRPDVARRLEVTGVSARRARHRVAALTDDEVRAAHTRLKMLPQQGPDETRLGTFAAALMLGTAFGGKR